MSEPYPHVNKYQTTVKELYEELGKAIKAHKGDYIVQICRDRSFGHPGSDDIESVEIVDQSYTVDLIVSDNF